MRTESFRQAMARTGLRYDGPIVPDGQLHRFRADGDHGRNGWYVLHLGPPLAGVFGCWKRGIKETWCENRDQYSHEEWRRIRAAWKRAEEERERAEQKLQARAREVAASILRHSKPASSDHPYLVKKKVGVHGELHESRGSLVLPLRDVKGVLHSLQFIDASGQKRFLRDGRVHGCFFTLPGKTEGPLVICEGYATGASIHEATGYAVIAAMNCGNLLSVAQALRQRWPSREIIIAADNDAWTPGNPGVSKAREAALTIGARLAVPEFKERSKKPTDFNDLATLEGG